MNFLMISQYFAEDKKVDHEGLAVLHTGGMEMREGYIHSSKGRQNPY